MSQPEQNKAYVDQPLFAAKPSFIDLKARVGFTFGIARCPIVLPGSASARDRAYSAGLRRIDQAEAVQLLVERLAAKANLATRDPYEARLLFLELSGWRPRCGDLLGEPAPSAALAEALATLQAAIAPAPPKPVDTLDTLRAELAGLRARLEQFEATGSRP